ncbi:hypothetical protein E3N88_38550 [Mikania micrantha]|uniref:CCHC-type domain-containing protein n=1 Tax=Mikania micrantha TaxID=192012 RepID=A0A5N6LUB7_9ASTR|nr:hypothetical protein E3N88_38550 [Mikania micrantha]
MMMNDEQVQPSMIDNTQKDNLFSVPIQIEQQQMNLQDEDTSVNDPFLILLCFDNNDEDEVDPNSVEDSSDSEKDYDKDVEDDEDYKDEGVLYPCYDPNIDWKLVKPIVTMKFENPAQLKEMLIDYAVAVFGFINKDPDAYVSNWFKKDMFNKTYKHGITPLKGSIHWPKTNDIKPLPPQEKRMPGRPTVKRKRDLSEKEKKNKTVGIGRKMICQNCHENGHNKRSCQKEKKDPQPKEPKRKGRKEKKMTQEV